MADELSQVTVTGSLIRDYKVTLVRAASKYGGGRLEYVKWDATPELSESRSVVYKNIEPTHAPGGIYQYGNTGSRTFSIQGKFVSRSVNEATKNLAYIQYLRTWAMPVFGQAGTQPGETILGAPPAVLLLSAYSIRQPNDDSQSTVPIDGPFKDRLKQVAIGNNLFEIPVVITSLEIPFPSDVDYIPTVNNIPVPTIVTVTVSLTETHSPNRYSEFSIEDFKNGNLKNF